MTIKTKGFEYIINCLCDSDKSFSTSELASGCSMSEAEVSAFLTAILPFGAIYFDKVTNNYHLPEIGRETRKSFLKSYLFFVIEKTSFVSDWGRLGINDSCSGTVLEKGVELLSSIEKRRLSLFPDAEALVTKKLCNGLITALDKNENKYLLMRINQRSKFYQFIGGFIRNEKAISAMRSELVEEVLHYERFTDSSFKIINALDKEIAHNIFSPTFGHYISYCVSYFYIYINKEIDLSPDLRWISIDEIKNAKTFDGFNILPPKSENHKILQLLEDCPVTYNFNIECKGAIEKADQKVLKEVDLDKISLNKLLKIVPLKQLVGICTFLFGLVIASFTLGYNYNNSDINLNAKEKTISNNAPIKKNTHSE